MEIIFIILELQLFKQNLFLIKRKSLRHFEKMIEQAKTFPYHGHTLNLYC